jgi:hypothetical protein
MRASLRGELEDRVEWEDFIDGEYGAGFGV